MDEYHLHLPTLIFNENDDEMMNLSVKSKVSSINKVFIGEEEEVGIVMERRQMLDSHSQPQPT